jgi:hypothetical protein
MTCGFRSAQLKIFYPHFLPKVKPSPQLNRLTWHEDESWWIRHFLKENGVKADFIIWASLIAMLIIGCILTYADIVNGPTS